MEKERISTKEAMKKLIWLKWNKVEIEKKIIIICIFLKKIKIIRNCGKFVIYPLDFKFLFIYVIGIVCLLWHCLSKWKSECHNHLDRGECPNLRKGKVRVNFFLFFSHIYTCVKKDTYDELFYHGVLCICT